MSGGPIFFGDLADALRILDPVDSVTEARISELLGLPLALPRTSSRPPDERKHIEVDEPPPPLPTSPPATTRFFASRIESVASQSASTASVTFGAPTTSISISGSEETEPRLQLDSLLRPASSRAVLSAAVSTRLAIGIDVARTVEKLARREPLERLPLRHVRSLRRGVQLLFDKSAGMLPFLRDQAFVLHALSRVVGHQMIDLATFTGAPQRGLRRKHLRSISTYHPPLAGTPIVAFTDLGIAQPESLERPGTAGEWLEFAAIARRAGCPFITFVPYDAGRWPIPLRRAMTIVTWDRSLTAGAAAKRARSAAL